MRRKTQGMRAIAIAMLAVGVAGCDLAPRYVPPDLRIPQSYQGSAAWPLARPDDTTLPKDWWRMFHNSTLDALEPRVLNNNPDLAAAFENLQQARDLTIEAGYGLYPQISAANTHDIVRRSNREPLRRGGPDQYTDDVSNIQASWELDLWGQLRNSLKAQKKLAQASAANVAGLMLSLQAELAHDYIVLRSLDAEIVIYQGAIRYYQNGLDITQMRLAHQIASGLDVDQAQNQLSSTQAKLADLNGQRQVMQHAIAVLLGENASLFVLPPQDQVAMDLPGVPQAVPSVLLQRRPDIAQAERNMQAANAKIGVARAAFYPAVSLNAASGFENDGLSFPSLSSEIWSVGTAISLPLFENGLRQAVLQYARAGFEQTRDQYASTVLSAFGDVEDQLARGLWLQVQVDKYREATRAAVAGQQLALQLYTAGAADYLNVVVDEGYALTAQRSQIQADTAQLTNRVDLIRALGGGWSIHDLPDDTQIVPKGIGLFPY